MEAFSSFRQYLKTTGLVKLMQSNKVEHAQMLHVERMKTEDIPFAVQLASRAGWGLTEGDFEFAMELEPEGCFVLFEDLDRIGLATNVSFGRIAWFGNLVVSETRRNKGAGSLLVEHSVNHLRNHGVETVVLYAYVERIPFYQRLDFTSDLDISVLTCTEGRHRKGDQL
jgi:GNAT superfamily N-acetyltransferase